MKTKGLASLFEDQAPGEVSEKIIRISILYLNTTFHCLRPRFLMVQMPKFKLSTIFVKYLL